MLKILQARLQQYVNLNFQMFKLVLEKTEEPEIKLPTSAGSWKKQKSSRKTSISAFLTMPKPLTVTEDEMAGWHQWLDGHESEWTLGVNDGQGGLACCDSWGRKESDTTEQLNWTELMIPLAFTLLFWVRVYTPFLCFLSREDPLAIVGELVWWCWILLAFFCKAFDFSFIFEWDPCWVIWVVSFSVSSL